jgi:imidazolonepropionase-like amidohydrolase
MRKADHDTSNISRLRTRCRTAASILIVACLSALVPVQAAVDAPFDLVLMGGRVIDPETGLDAVRNVGLRDGRISAVSGEDLEGVEEVDVTGLIVAPGFINVHSHGWTPLAQNFEVADGVTTALELEAGTFPASSLGTFEPVAIAGRSRLNFGASVGHAFARGAVLEGDDAVSGFDDQLARALSGSGSIDMERPAFRQALDSGQVDQLEVLLRRELGAGTGLGIGMLLDYMSEAVSEQEMHRVFEVAGDTGAPIFIHIRRGVAGDPAGLIEVIDLAKATGAQVHICHVQASAMGGIAEFLRLIGEARDEGVRISTESFPYNAGSTSNTAAVFNRDWRRIFAISYEDVEIAATGERFTRESWDRYRETAPGTGVIHHYNREAWTSIATNAPDVLVAADGVPVVSLESNVAPFGIGTNARILGRYVREKQSLSMVDALRKMTLLPAQMLGTYNPAFDRKGRVQVGMDADITVFDPQRVMDRATYRAPYQQSAGIPHVIVGGEFVVRDGKLLQNAFPGKRVARSGSGARRTGT